ncbi:uncharacterized protein LOC123554752 [Mercenaria mercenaria]|uniref:uncharacterized protein LOC123554752 n=1 Tax=Mercenaria mercenaria TaxID=6596 RepID=UPI001E1DA5DF|nr:uncharacterized protein LOC123554752 [Mercenaria mercenaria]
MKNLNALYFCILIITVTVASVSSIRCYVCVSCKDPFDESSATTSTCSGSCVKAKTGDSVIRGCSDFNGGDACEKINGAEACSCTSDLCNSASGISISVAVFSFAIICMFLWLN